MLDAWMYVYIDGACGMTFGICAYVCVSFCVPHAHLLTFLYKSGWVSYL